MAEINATAPVKLTHPAKSSSADKHSRVQDINNKIQEAELIIELLERSEKTLSSCTWDVKNVIQIMQLETT
jgi:hypothetical protein